jgi:beta-galactosidase
MLQTTWSDWRPDSASVGIDAMTRVFFRFALAFCILVPAFSGVPAQTTAASPHTFTVSGRQFLLDGKPYQVISGEMHYPRVPRAYWRDRFRKARAMGLNTITTYVFWNIHEPRPGAYDFSGQNDVAEYIREAQQEGLNVILRPGPYVCAEWDLGGYPFWLLKDRSMVLRSSDPKYLAEMNRWFARLGKEISPLLLRNGGPIIAIQVENEYGSFGDDHAYMEAVKKSLEQNGMAADVLYTADGVEQIPKGSLPELPAVINFGSGEAKDSFAALKSIRPSGPFMSGEYWAGWFDHWGEKHHTTDAAREAAELEWMLRNGYSVSMYMFHGGTSFGWMNGANSDGKNYEPDTTSYDYDAPLNESGQPTKKFYAMRDAIARVTGKSLPEVPAPSPAREFSFSTHVETASLWNNLPKPVETATLLTMEDLDQAYGYILYRTELAAGDGGELAIDGLHDYAQVYVNQKLVGSLDRRLNTSRMNLPIEKSARTLDILVENTGRVNFTTVLRGERKGITESVRIVGKEPKSWKIYSLPMDKVEGLHFLSGACDGPCFYRVGLTVPEVADTFIDTRSVHKGEAWINGRPVGRFWSIGPQFTLFTPGSWLRKGQNDVVFFDLMGSSDDSLKSVAKSDDGLPKDR